MNPVINGEDDGILSKNAESGIRGARRDNRGQQDDGRHGGLLAGRRVHWLGGCGFAGRAMAFTAFNNRSTPAPAHDVEVDLQVYGLGGHPRKIDEVTPVARPDFGARRG
jgi:hypothetical protein